MNNINLILAIVLPLGFLLLSAASCNRKDNNCEKSAQLVFFGTGDQCNMLILVDNDLYEPSNLADFQFTPLFTDSQNIKITYERNFVFSDCGASDEITLFCISDTP